MWVLVHKGRGSPEDQCEIIILDESRECHKDVRSPCICEETCYSTGTKKTMLGPVTSVCALSPFPSASRVIPAILGGRRSFSDIICSTGTKNLSTCIVMVCEGCVITTVTIHRRREQGDEVE